MTVITAVSFGTPTDADTISITVPNTVNVDDLIDVMVGGRGSSVAVFTQTAGPALDGFKFIKQASTTDTSYLTCRMYTRRIAATSERGQVITFSTGFVGPFCVSLLAHRGIDTTTPIEYDSHYYTNNAGIATGAGPNITSDNVTLVGYMLTNGGGDPTVDPTKGISPPSGFTEATEAHAPRSSGGCALEVAYRVVQSGQQSDLVWTAGDGSRSIVNVHAWRAAVTSSPVADAGPNQTLAAALDVSPVLTATISGGVAPYTGAWSEGTSNPQAVPIDNRTALSTTIGRPIQEGTYTYTYAGTDSGGGAFSDSVTLTFTAASTPQSASGQFVWRGAGWVQL